MLRSKALIPWIRLLRKARRRGGRGHWGWEYTHQLPSSLAEIAHEANVWLRACDHNLGYFLENTDPEVFDRELVSDYLIQMMSNPPPALLAAAPGKARYEMKRAIKAYDPLCHLLSEDEKAGLVTEADKRAPRAFIRADTSFGFLESFIDTSGVFSPTDAAGSWVVWALDKVSNEERRLPLVPPHTCIYLIRLSRITDGVPPLPCRLVWPQPLRARASYARPLLLAQGAGGATTSLWPVSFSRFISPVYHHTCSGKRRAWRTCGASR